jgi:regulator of RNase E activity RraA
VFPGTLLHADANGVTTIPHEIASDVAHAAAEFVAAETYILDYLKTGERDGARFSEVRHEAMARIAELGRRVRARAARMA